VASWVIAILLLSVGGLFLDLHHRGEDDRTGLSLGPSGAIEDALVW
jgi:hypothetical protein